MLISSISTFIALGLAAQFAPPLPNPIGKRFDLSIVSRLPDGSQRTSTGSTFDFLADGSIVRRTRAPGSIPDSPYFWEYEGGLTVVKQKRDGEVYFVGDLGSGSNTYVLPQNSFGWINENTLRCIGPIP